MALLDSLKEFYGKMEDGYYSLLDSIQNKGVPVYSVVDAIESANIPSFPVAILASLLAVISVYALITGALGGAVLTVTVQDADLNPISGATVAAIFEGKEVDSRITDAQGAAVLKVPLNSQVSIAASKNGFEDSKSDFLAQKSEETKTITLHASVTASGRTITFVQAGTSRLLGDEFEARFSCSGNDFDETKTVTGGIIDLELKSDCDTLTVTPAQGYSVEEGTVSFSSDSEFRFEVQKAGLGNGSVVAAVSSESGNTVAGIDVSLYLAREGGAAGTVVQTKSTSANGTAVFDSVASGRYYIVAFDRSGNFAEYDGLSEGAVQEVRASATAQFAVVLAQSVAGKIRLLVEDKATGDAVAGARVILSKGQTQISSTETGSDGRLEFPVGEDVEYNILVDKAGYLLNGAKLRPSADYAIVEIEEATEENSESLLVTVVDEKDRPVENVRVRLKLNSDGSDAGGEIATGLDGRALFERVDEGTYYVYAVKPGYGEKTSDPLQVSSRQQNVLRLKLPIGNGRIDVGVLDDTGKPVAGASVKAVDAPTFQAIESATSDSDGKKTLTIRADKKVFLIVSADGYLNTTTAPLQMQKDISIAKQVVLVKSVPSFGIVFEGLYAGDESVSSAGTSLNAGQMYTAKFRLLVPKSASFDEAGVHVRSGAVQNNSIEKDVLYISGVRGAYNALLESTTYTEPTGQATDLQHQTTGNAKWANVIFRKASGGVYEVEADIQVKEEARIGSLLELWYRAWAKSGGYLRAPNDASLGTSESTPQKQGLYANALKTTFSIGPTSLCGDDFCARYSIEDLGGGLTSNITDNYTGQVDGKYRLLFEISSIARTPFSASQLIIKDKTSGMGIESYKIKTALGEERTGQKSGSEISTAIGEMGRDSVISGEVIFTARKEGTIPIDISVVSGSGTASEVYKKTIFIKALPASKMQIDIVPKIIVPLINNNILVRVSDANDSIANAKVNVKRDGEIIASGETDADGVFAYTLSSPSDGSRIGFAVEKQGFRPTEFELRVSPNILSSQPQSIRLSLAVGGRAFKTIDASILNYSQIPLQVEKISAGKEFNGFATIVFEAPEEGTVLAPDSNAVLSGKISLGEKGNSIGQPTKILGTISILVSNPNFPQKWLAAIPFELNLGFGNEVDDTECFAVSPVEWKIMGSTKEAKQIIVSMKNSCKVGGESVILKDVSARIAPGSDDTAGKFVARSSLDASRNVELSGAFAVIAGALGQDGEGTIRIEFRPSDIVSVNAETKIEIQATHLTTGGAQKLTRSISIPISLNNLNECVQVLPERDITVQSCPLNTGFGNYGSRFSQFSNTRYGAFDPYSSQYGYGTGVPPYLRGATQNGVRGDSYFDYQGMGSYMNSYYPNTSSFGAPFYPAEGINQSFNNMWSCGQGGLQVQNNCASPIEVSFDAQPGINVKDKTITIQPKETADVSVEPTNFFGRYGLGIRAKVALSNQKPANIKVLYVNVANELAKNYRDCISVSPSPTLAFNNFIPVPVTLKVINTCYDQGVFLDGSNNTISFAGSGVSNPTNPFSAYGQAYTPITGAGGTRSFPTGAGQPTTGVQSSSGVPITGAPAPGAIGTSPTTPLNMVQSWAFLDEQISTQPNGKVTQTLSFEVVKNFSAYSNNAPPFNALGANNFQDIGNLRYFVTSGYYAVQSRANLIVRVITPYAGERQISFPMVVQDMWQALPYAEQLSKTVQTFGDQGITDPDKCINDAALNFSVLGHVNPEQSYRTELNGSLFKINEKGGCGNLDKIEGEFDPKSFTKNGLTMTVTHNGHEAVVGFSNLQNWQSQGGRETVFDETMRGIVSRVSPPVSKYHAFKVRITVKAQPGQGTGSGTGTGTGTGTGGTGGTGQVVSTLPADYAFSCADPNAKTGDAAFRDYGFQHFSFDWRWPEGSGATAKGVQKDSCDALQKSGETYKDLRPTDLGAAGTPWFCDSVQSTLAIAQKAAEIKSASGTLSATENGQCSTASGFECGNSANRNSRQLFRYALKQEQTTAYFIDRSSAEKDDRVADIKDLLNEDKQALAGILNSLGSNANPSTDLGQNKRIINATSSVIEKLLGTSTQKGILSSERYSGTDVVLEIKGIDFDTKHATTKNVGFIKISGSWYLLKLQDYKNLHDVIVKCIETADPKECTDAKYGTITTQFLGDLGNKANATWKLAARNDPNLGPEAIRLIMKNAKWETGDAAVKAKFENNFYQFYKADIATKLYLVRDNYGNSLVGILKGDGSEYKEKLSGITLDFRTLDSSFDSKTLEAGEYDVNIEYSWGSTEDTKVKLEQAKPLAKIDAKYPANPLFTMPIDGGVEWGTNFARQGGATPMYFNSYGLQFDPGNASNTPQTKQKNNAINSQPLSYGFVNSYTNGTEKGRIVSITGAGAITYSPSDPMKVSITLKNIRDTASAALFDYQIGNVNSPLEVSWKIDMASGSQASAVKTGKLSVSEVCPDVANASDVKHDSVKIEAKQGDATAQALVYSPQSRGAKLQFVLLPCRSAGGDSAGASYAPDNTPVSSVPIVGSRELTLQKDGTDAYTYNLKSILQKVRGNGQVCIIPTAGNGIDLYWNDGALLNGS